MCDDIGVEWCVVIQEHQSYVNVKDGISYDTISNFVFLVDSCQSDVTIENKIIYKTL